MIGLIFSRHTWQESLVEIYQSWFLESITLDARFASLSGHLGINQVFLVSCDVCFGFCGCLYVLFASDVFVFLDVWVLFLFVWLVFVFLRKSFVLELSFLFVWWRLSCLIWLLRLSLILLYFRVSFWIDSTRFVVFSSMATSFCSMNSNEISRHFRNGLVRACRKHLWNLD